MVKLKMGLVNANVKLTKYKKVLSISDMTHLEDLPEEKCGCCSIQCSDPCNCGVITETTSTLVPSSSSIVNSVGNSEEIDSLTISKPNSSEPMDDDCSSNEDSSSSSGSSAFRSGTLTRRSRRTSRELRSKEHMEQCIKDGTLTSQHCPTSCELPSATVEEPGNSEIAKMKPCTDVISVTSSALNPAIDTSSNSSVVIDGKMATSSTCDSFMVAVTTSSGTDPCRGRTLSNDTANTIKGFVGIGPRSAIRRHSIHSGVMTLPKMTGLVGLTLSDLKTRRKDFSPLPSGMSALIDFKIFRNESQNVNTNAVATRDTVAPGTPMPNRPSTISYSSRFRNSIGRRRKSITSIENLFKTFRSISSPTPPVLEELDEPDSTTSPTPSNNHNKVFIKQISSSSLKSQFSGSSSSSSSCHSSPMSTPLPERKSANTAQVMLAAEVVPLDLEEMIKISEEYLLNSPSTTLGFLKVCFKCGDIQLYKYNAYLTMLAQ